MLHLNIEAKDAKDLQAQITDLAGSGGLLQYSDEGLLAEVRQRMASKGLVVRIVKFADETEDNASEAEAVPAAEEKKKPGRKAAVKPVEPPTPTATVEPVKLVEPSSDTAKAMVAASGPSSDDVKKALDAFALLKGQMPTREIMTRVGGAPRLMDVPPAKYGAIIAAVKAELALPVAA